MFTTRMMGFVFVIAIAHGASADTTLFNNLGPGDTHYPASFSDFVHRAYSFTPNEGADFFLTSITAPLALTNPAHTNLFQISLYSDANGEPGAELEGLTVTDLPLFVPGATSLSTTFNFSGTTVLEDGATYWFVVAPTAGTRMDWYWNIDGFVLGPMATRAGPDSPWSVIDQAIMGGFRVQGTLVPEPATLSLLGLSAFALLRRRYSA